MLKLIGDGVLAMFTNENMALARRAALSAEHRFRRNMRALNSRRTGENRPVTTAHVGLHVGEVFYGNIGSDDRLDFTVVGPAVNEVSRIASMCRSARPRIADVIRVPLRPRRGGAKLSGLHRPLRAARHQPRAGSLYARSGYYGR